jgi:hypothetical protein
LPSIATQNEALEHETWLSELLLLMFWAAAQLLPL